MKIHILRRESVTPIERYLERARHSDSYEARLDFAVVLLYREREYRSMYGSRWLMGDKPAPTPDGPFAPFDLTADAAAALTSALVGNVDAFAGAVVQTNDLFGLKPEASDGLTRTLRAIRAHRFGWLIYARLLADLSRFDEAMLAAEKAVSLGCALPARGAVNDAALVDTLEALDEQIRRQALRIRARVEGTAFTRFLTTELAFCRQEREAALQSFDDSHVPAELRDLIPLAREIGVGDDPCRSMFIGRMAARKRRAAADRIRSRADDISRWLARVGDPPYSGEAAAFFWLLEAADELSGS